MFCHQEELQKSPTAHEETRVAHERQCHISVEVTRRTGGRVHPQLRLQPELHQMCGLSHESATPSTVLREHYRCSLTMSGMNWILCGDTKIHKNNICPLEAPAGPKSKCHRGWGSHRGPSPQACPLSTDALTLLQPAICP